MSEKKKRKQLTIEERWEIICRLDGGATATSVASAYEVTVSAVSRIKKNRANIMRYKKLLDHCQATTTRKKATGIENSRLDRCMHRWFTQKRCLDEPVSGAALKAKAYQYNRILNGPETFKASSGWLEKFKCRYRVTDLSIDPEKFSADSEVSRRFYQEFVDYLRTNGCEEDRVYNATEASISWRTLPIRAFHSRREAELLSEDRVTMMVCANASGTRKLPLMVIGKERDPECLRGADIESVVYKSQRDAWMTDEVFFEWYREIFLPEVEKRRAEKGGRCVLLLDNAPPHPAARALKSLSDLVDVVYLPASVGSTIQPMKQGIIDKIKRVYKMNLLLRRTPDDEALTLLDYMNSLTMRYCCKEIGEAWKSVSEADAAKAWRHVFRRRDPAVGRRERMDSRLLLEMLRRISEGGKITAEEKDSWLLDNNDPGWRILNDDDILFNDFNFWEDDVKIEKIDCPERRQECPPSASDALLGCNYLEAWIQTRSECTQRQLAVLRQLREFALDATFAEKLYCRNK